MRASLLLFSKTGIEESEDRQLLLWDVPVPKATMSPVDFLLHEVQDLDGFVESGDSAVVNGLRQA